MYPMKKYVLMALSLVMLAGACAPKSAYETRKGKKKLKHYNSMQYQ